MTDPTFSRPGAVDLSSLAGGPQGSSPGANYVTDVTESGFNQLVALSAQHPVIVEFHSPRDAAGAAVTSALTELVNAADGRFLLARVDVDVEQQLAQSIGVQGVPMVVALIAGQLAPLFQGTRGVEEIRPLLDQVAQLAVANGITGRAQAIARASAGATSEEPPSDPRFDAADAALQAGDYAAAVAEFDTLLAATPNDPEVIAGRAQASLLQRSLGFDPAAVVQRASAEPDDPQAQFDAADLEVIQGAGEAAMDRLLGLLAETGADEREPIRLRILELFEVLGRTDPVVAKARRRLSSLLF